MYCPLIETAEGEALDRSAEELSILIPTLFLASSSAVSGITEIFEAGNKLARRDHVPSTVRITWWAHGSDGLLSCIWDTHPGLPHQPRYIIVPPCSGHFFQKTPDYSTCDAILWLKNAAAAGAVIGTVYDGIMLLAETGLIDGMAVSVHQEMREAFAAHSFPIKATADQEIIERNGFIISSSPIGWVDISLMFTKKIFGTRVMLELAGHLMVSPPEAGNPDVFARLSPTGHRKSSTTTIWPLP